jgi:excinuclease ABC subunit A
LKKASQYNLKGIDASFPLGKMIGVTGVSGSGKSTLIIETLYKALQYNLEGKYEGILGEYELLDGYQYVDKVYLVDQSPIGRTPRSNPATYIGAFDHIRDIFAQSSDAKMKGYSKGRFSFNVKGEGEIGNVQVLQVLSQAYATRGEQVAPSFFLWYNR